MRITEEFEATVGSTETEVRDCEAHSVVNVRQHVVCPVNYLYQSVEDEVSEGVCDHEHQIQVIGLVVPVANIVEHPWICINFNLGSTLPRKMLVKAWNSDVYWK
jgi:hypothetical protein